MERVVEQQALKSLQWRNGPPRAIGDQTALIQTIRDRNVAGNWAEFPALPPEVEVGGNTNNAFYTFQCQVFNGLSRIFTR